MPDSSEAKEDQDTKLKSSEPEAWVKKPGVLSGGVAWCGRCMYSHGGGGTRSHSEKGNGNHTCRPGYEEGKAHRTADGGTANLLVQTCFILGYNHRESL